MLLKLKYLGFESLTGQASTTKCSNWSRQALSLARYSSTCIAIAQMKTLTTATAMAKSEMNKVENYPTTHSMMQPKALELEPHCTATIPWIWPSICVNDNLYLSRLGLPCGVWACALSRCHARSHTNNIYIHCFCFLVYSACSGSPRINSNYVVIIKIT